MRIPSRTITLLCLLNLTLGQRNDVENKSEEELTEDSGWWSRRIGKLNGNVGLGIGLEKEDNARQQAERWDNGKTEIRDSRSRRPRPFASVQHSSAETRSHDDHHYASKGEGNFLNDRETTTTRIIVDFKLPSAPGVPSPILLPPYATPSPIYRNGNDINVKRIVLVPLSTWNNESTLNKTGKSSVTSSSSSLERTRFRDIAKLNFTNNKNTRNNVKTSYANDSAKYFHPEYLDGVSLNFQRVNGTRLKNGQESNDNSDNRVVSFDNEEKLRQKKIGDFGPTQRNNYNIKSSRGDKRYRDSMEDEKSLMRKRMFFGSRKYDWARRSGHRTNHLRLTDDSFDEMGSVPGIPGRDYPIHQEHTHYNLRNHADRFACPPIPKTHIYLADRASRCQIFYVCYGLRTGVPMVCPNGTLFSEPLQVCDWWYNVSC